MGAIFEIFRSMDIVGKTIVVLLAGISVYMWGVIFAKLAFLNGVERANKRIYARFKEFNGRFARDYLQVFRDFPDNSKMPLYVLYRECCDAIFLAEKARNEDVEDAEKLLDTKMAEEVNNLEEGLTFLSVTSTVAPFMGMLGTVWGIMVSFRKMTQMGTTTLSTVAPGIAVALVTTVVGLIVAIPAVCAFFYFRAKIDKQLVLMEKFSKEIIVKIGRLVSLELEE